KKPPGEAVFSKVKSVGELLNRVTGLVEHRYQILSFQCSRSRAITSRLLISKSTWFCYQWLLPVAISRVFPDWTQDDSYRIRRSSRTERGVRAYSPAWSELPTRN
ncbi:hypothetical protein B4U29_29640, partial [Klebsiella pneumoniae]